MNRPPVFTACLVFVEHTNNEANVSADMSSFWLCTLADGIDPLNSHVQFTMKTENESSVGNNVAYQAFV